MKTILTLISSLIFLSLNLKGQMFLYNTPEEILEHYELDSASIKWDSNTISFPIDSINSGTAIFEFEYDLCFRYTFTLTCQECYETYLFQLTEDYYSEWFQYNDSVYYLKRGNIGWKKTPGEEKKYEIPKMTLNYSKANKTCMTATITSHYIKKSEYNQSTKNKYQTTKKIKVKKRELNGTWEVQTINISPPELYKMEIIDDSTKITYTDKTQDNFTIEWISKNTFQLWFYDIETNEPNIYLTCEIMSISDGKLQVWFYDESAKYHKIMNKWE